MCPGIIFHGRKQTVTVTIFVLLNRPPSASRSTLLRFVSVSRSVCLGIINYTDEPGPPTGFASILSQPVTFRPGSRVRRRSARGPFLLRTYLLLICARSTTAQRMGSVDSPSGTDHRGSSSRAEIGAEISYSSNDLCDKWEMRV